MSLKLRKKAATLTLLLSNCRTLGPNMARMAGEIMPFCENEHKRWLLLALVMPIATLL